MCGHKINFSHETTPLMYFPLIYYILDFEEKNFCCYGNRPGCYEGPGESRCEMGLRLKTFCGLKQM